MNNNNKLLAVLGKRFINFITSLVPSTGERAGLAPDFPTCFQGLCGGGCLQSYV